MDEDDLIAIAVQRRTDLSPTSLKSTIEILKEIATEQIANGSSVEFGRTCFICQSDTYFCIADYHAIHHKHYPA